MAKSRTGRPNKKLSGDDLEQQIATGENQPRQAAIDHDPAGRAIRI